MRLICSLPNPDGHVVVAKLAPDARVVVRFHDGPDDVVDLTDHVADLVLLGMQVQAARAAGTEGVPAAEEQVEAGRVEVVGGSWPAPSFLYAHPASRTVMEAGWDEVQGVLELGIVAQLTAGVAAEAAEDLPDTPPSDLDADS